MTTTEYMLFLAPSLPPRTIVPAGKDLLYNSSELSVVTSNIPVGVKAIQPGWFVGNSEVMPHIHRHRLIDGKTQERIPGGTLVIIGRLNIGGAGDGSGHSFEGIRSVDIDPLSILQTLYTLIEFSTFYRQICDGKRSSEWINDIYRDHDRGSFIPGGILCNCCQVIRS